MTTCEQLSDRMPEVAHGESAWSPAEAEQLGGCESCRAELGLVRAAARLGQRAALRVDPARVAAQVADRLRAERRAAPRVQAWSRRLAIPLALAATLALVVWSSRVDTPPPTVPTETLTAMLDELDGLDAAELQVVLDAVEVPGEEAYRPFDAPESLGDLSDTELEAVLSTLEG